MRDQLRAQQAQFKQDRPGMTASTEFAGSMMMPGSIFRNPVTREAGLVGDVGIGAAMGGLYGAGTAKEMQDVPSQAFINSLFGGGGTAALSTLGRGLAPNVRPEAAALREQGIPLTPGSAFGGAIQKVEQSAESMPIIGSIVTGAREKQFEQFNTAAYNKVLKNINPTLKIGANVAGRDAYNFVESTIRNEYTRIAPQLRVAYSPRVEKSFDAVVSRYAKGKLPTPLAKEFETYVNGLKADFSANQVIDGRRAQAIKEDLGNMAQAYSSAQGSERLLSNAYRDLQSLYMNLMRNQNPAYAKELTKVDSAFKDFVRVQTAMAKTRGEEAIFTPSQLEQAVRQSDKSVRKGAFARGNAPMQELAQRGVSVLGQKVPDSGTASRGMVGALLTGGATYVDPTIGALTGLMSAPYYKYGEKMMFAPRPESFTEAVQRARTAVPYAVPGLIGLTENLMSR
ncbi:hypothetical protein [Flavobacterium sp.]|uniref:hypothetical protein n=1 Tax=Flavobacterium sp. TaxID=239 RepID=UPI0037C0E63D